MANYRVTYCSLVHRIETFPDGKVKLEKPDCEKCQSILSVPAGSRNCQLSEAEKRLLTVPFGKKALKFSRAKDVDARVEAFRQKYPMLREDYKPRSLREIIRDSRKGK